MNSRHIIWEFNSLLSVWEAVVTQCHVASEGGVDDIPISRSYPMFLILSLVLASPFMAAVYFYVDELAYDVGPLPEMAA